MDKDCNVDQLRDILAELYGEVLSLQQECPGVCYASVRQDEADTFSHEYYIVYKATDAISSKAKAYGQPVTGYPDLLVYPMDKPDSGYKIVEYEPAISCCADSPWPFRTACMNWQSTARSTIRITLGRIRLPC